MSLIVEKNRQWTMPLIKSVLVSCLSGIQYGFHMSELNAPGSMIKLNLVINDTQLGIANSIFSIGGLIGSTIGSSISMKRGLKLSFLITSVCYIIGSIIESKSIGYISLLIGRLISGIGGGLAIVYVPLYLNDISHIKIRGILGSMTQISVNLGILITQLLALLLGNENWRQVLSFGYYIGLISLISIYLGYLVESPKWLILGSLNNTDTGNGSENGNEDELNNRKDEGIEVLCKLRGIENKNDDIKNEIEIWEEEKLEHIKLVESKPYLKKMNFWYYLTDINYSNSRKIATIIMIGQQFSGINSVIFYGVEIINKVFPKYSVLINIIISVVNMLITSIASLFLDRKGRKPLLTLSLVLMTISSIGLSFGILQNKSILSVISIFSYVGSFAIGCGPIPFLIVSEVSQIEIKNIAQSWATDCNWVSVFIIGIIFPMLSNFFGNSGYVYIIFAVISALFAMWVISFVPETKGKATYNEVWNERSE